MSYPSLKLNQTNNRQKIPLISISWFIIFTKLNAFKNSF